MRATLRTTGASILAGLTAAAAVVYLGRASDARLRIQVDLEVTGGAMVRLYLNEATEPLLTRTVVGRHLYEFSDIAGPITQIRLDPVDVSDVEVRLYGIAVVAPDGRIAAHYGSDAIQQWIIRDFEVIAANRDALEIRSTTAHPFMIGLVPVVAAGEGGGFWSELAIRLRREPWLPCLLLLPVLSLTQVRPLGAWLWRLAALIAVAAVWPSIVSAVHAMAWGPTPSVVAISRAAYVGASLPAIQMAVVAGFLAAASAGMLAALVRAPAMGAPVVVTDSSPLRRWLIAVGAGAIAIATAPDLDGLAGWIRTVQYTPHWDYDNILAWSYWIAHGHLPFRDFWYPYGGLFLFDLPWPAGPLIAWTAAVARYSVFAFALLLASPGRPWSVAIATAALMLAESSGLNLAGHRYLLGINVVLAYVAARRAEFRRWPPLLMLGAALVMPLVLEPAQLVYAAPAVVVLVGIDLIKQRSFAIVRRALVFGGGVAIGASVLLAMLLWWHGMLRNAIAVYAQLGDMVQYSAMPAVLTAEIWPAFALTNVVAWLPTAMVVIGLVEYRRADVQAYTRASALVGLAVLAFLVLQKHLVRPVPETMVLYALVAGLAFGVMSPAGRWPVDRIGAAIGAGVLVGLLILHGRGGALRGVAARVPSQLIGTARVLASSDAIDQANRSRYAPERFALFRQQRQLVDQLTSRHGGPVRVFTLTDDPVVYLFTGQAPPWHHDQYSGSPVYEQRRTVGELRSAPPDYVVALRSRLAFDAVPLAVRVPEIVEFVITHFVPDAPVGHYTVLRPRRPDEPAPASFWRDFFGQTLDLGMLPMLLADEERSSCSSATECDDVVVLSRAGAAADRTTSVAVTAGDLVVNLAMRTTPEVDRYVIPLSRLWPGVAARAAGLPLNATAPAGFTLSRLQLQRPAGRLY